MLACARASFDTGAFQTGTTPSGFAPFNRPFTRQGTSDSATSCRGRPQNRGSRRPFNRAGTAAPSHDTPNTDSPNQAKNWSSAFAQGASGSSAQNQPQTWAGAPAATAAPNPSDGGSPSTSSWTQGTAEDPSAAEAAMPAPPTGKPAGSFPAFGTPGWSSATPMAGASASTEDTTTAHTAKQAFKWSGAFAQGSSTSKPAGSQPQPQDQAPGAAQPGAFGSFPAPMPSSGGPAMADAAAGIPHSAPKAAAVGTDSSTLRSPSVADWAPSPAPDAGKATESPPAFGTPGWSCASAVVGGAAKVPAFGTPEWAASLGAATPSAQGKQSSAASFGTKGWTFSPASKAHTAASSSTASTSAAEPAAPSAAALHWLCPSSAFCCTIHDAHQGWLSCTFCCSIHRGAFQRGIRCRWHNCSCS